MPRINRALIAIVAVPILITYSSRDPSCNAQQAVEPESIRPVRDVLERQVVDWNKHDLDGFLSGYWNSPKLVFQSSGRRIDGWETIRERYRSRYQAAGRSMGRLEFTGLDITPLSVDAVLARGAWSVAMPDGSQPHGLFTLIFRRFPEGWKIVHDHTSADETPAAAPAAAAEKKAAQ